MYTVDEWNALKFINNCDEVACGKPYDIKKHAQILSPNQKKIVLNYLKRGKVMAVAAGGVYDYVIDDMTGITIHAYTDDEYQWNTNEIYYFEHYDLALVPEFIEKVLKSA